jgi:hypothetical protein
MARITNINGTSDIICKCGSWLKHWNNFSGQTVTYCCVGFCIEKELVGAHVQKANSTDKNWYIIPLCQSHSRSIVDLEISDVFELVPANKKELCEK